MPFGLCNAPAIFQRFMQLMYSCEDASEFIVFIDDCVVASTTFDEHLIHLERFLKKVQDSGMLLNGEKCAFGQSAIHFLGHAVSAKGIQPEPEKVRAVREYPTPNSVANVRSFLGLASFYRRFIENFAQKAEPLRLLLKKDVRFFWSPAQDASFKLLQQALTTAPILTHFRPGASTEVRTDASNAGLGIILLEERSGLWHVVAYASRSLNPAEVNYTTSEKECLAVVWATQKFRPYLLEQPFRFITDHNGLVYLMTAQSPNYRLARWALKLAEFSFTVVYSKGKEHNDADCLSRHPVDPLPAEEDHFDELAVNATEHEFDLAYEQANDEYCQTIRRRLESVRPSVRRSFVANDVRDCWARLFQLERSFYPYLLKPWNVLCFANVMTPRYRVIWVSPKLTDV